MSNTTEQYLQSPTQSVCGTLLSLRAAYGSSKTPYVSWFVEVSLADS